MYINLHTKTHIFLKISIFCKKIITFSSSAHLMKKSTFLLKKLYFWGTKLTFFSTKIDIDRNTCHFASKFAQHYFITVLRNSLICPKTEAFWHKMLYFTKKKTTPPKIDTSKTEDTSIRKLNISIKN